MTKLTPRPNQERDIQRVLSEPTHAALIAHDMGFGKSLVGTEIVLRLGLPRTLIVGIRDTSKQWAETIRDQSDGRVKLRIMNSTKEGEANFKAFMEGAPGIFFSGVQWLTSRDWQVREKRDADGNPIPVIDKKTGLPTGKNETESIHLDLYGRRLVKLKTVDRAVDVVVVDEVHKMQNRHSQTARTITHIKSTWRIGMSGTFAGNKFEGAWKVTRWLWPDLIDNSFNRWKAAWCKTVVPTRKDGSEIKSSNPYGDTSTVVGELHEGAFVKSLPCYVRDEPDPVPEPRIVKVQLTPKQWEQYRSLERTSMAWLDAHTPAGKEPLIADLPITQRQRLRTATLGEMRFTGEDELGFDLNCASAKLNALKHIIDHIWVNQPILVGLYSQKFAQVAADRLCAHGYGAVAWHGGVSAKERAKIKERFIAGDPAYRYLIATIPSIGTGVDGLQKACSKAVVLEESDSITDNMQFIKRISRQGMTTAHGDFGWAKLVAEGTIDEGILAQHDASSASLLSSLRRVA